MLGPYRTVIISGNLEAEYEFDRYFKSPLGCLFKTFYYDEDDYTLTVPNMPEEWSYSITNWYYSNLISDMKKEWEIKIKNSDLEYLEILSKYAYSEGDREQKFVHWLNINKIPFEYE